uniref:Rpn family recombination-promoting nuclease/putative transposase n=1 Tax=Caenorhabditis tropicalis TaxID=1561998 RepID=A0A1I7UPG8_9PELO
MFNRLRKARTAGKKQGIGANYQRELIKITPDKLVIPVNDHLDIKISRLTTEITYATITLNSFAFDLVRAWFMKDGKEEEHKIKKEFNGHPDYESFSNKLSLYGMFHQFEKYEDVYLRVKLTENPDPFKRKWFLDEKPEGFLKIDYTREYQSRYEYSDIQFPLILISENEKVLEMKEKFLEDPWERKWFLGEKPEGFLEITIGESWKEIGTKEYPLILISENEKVLEMKEKFLEFRKNQNRRDRLKKLAPNEYGEYYAIIHKYCEVMNEVADEEEQYDAEKALEDVHEGILKSHGPKMDEMSDDEVKKLNEERKKEWIELTKKESIERRAEEAREKEIKKKEEEEKRKKEAANPKPIPVPIPEKKPKKKCMIM